MARSLFSLSMQALRAAERAQRVQAKQQIRNAREHDRANKQTYLENRTADVDEMNQVLLAKVEAIQSLLPSALARSVGINWNSLYRHVNDADVDELPELKIGRIPTHKSYMPETPGFFARVIPGWRGRFHNKVSEARLAYSKAQEEHHAVQQARQMQLGLMQTEAQNLNQQVATFRNAYLAGHPEAVSGFFDIIFDKSENPENMPDKWKTAFLSETRQLIVDFDLPTLDDIIPAIEKYKYTKSTDQIIETRRAQRPRQALYTSLVAQAVLRRLYEIFRSDRDGVVEVATINAYVDTIDPSTGQRIRPCLISVRTTRDDFEKLDLRHVEPVACLKRLNASLSRSPSELVAVKPILDIKMVDPRFIQENDVLSTLDNRPNLMELSPSEFENLITNLFQRMGLETKLTQASRDGGVDCVAFDPRPVLGGKVVVQAKRYKNTVGVSAVRDLFGTMMNEGASKGILVTTSGYGQAAYEFANGKPIELLSGSNLLYMLKEHGGIDAKIVMPDEWLEPRLDA